MPTMSSFDHEPVTSWELFRPNETNDQRSAFSKTNSFAASEVKLYLTVFSPNGLAGSMPNTVLVLGGFRLSAGP